MHVNMLFWFLHSHLLFRLLYLYAILYFTLPRRGRNVVGFYQYQIVNFTSKKRPLDLHQRLVLYENEWSFLY